MKKILSKATLIFIFISILLVILYASAQQDSEAALRKTIKSAYINSTKDCDSEVDLVTDVNGKIEFWILCNKKNGDRIITISSHNGGTYYQEIFYERKGNLSYAKETENGMPLNQFKTLSWSCEYYIEDDKTVRYLSHGHGKTEDETWEPETIFELYKKRMSELKEIKKKKGNYKKEQTTDHVLSNKIGFNRQGDSYFHYLFYQTSLGHWLCHRWTLDSKGKRINDEILTVSITENLLQTLVKIGEQTYQHGIDTEGPPGINGHAYRAEYLVTLPQDEAYQLISLKKLN